MKIGKLILVVSASSALAGIAHAGQASAQGVVKKITLTAHIDDSIFVSAPDGSAWYSTVELDAEDHTQRTFNKTLPLRVWTKSPDFNVTLAQPLKLSNGYYEMVNAKVALSSHAGDSEVPVGSARKITQVKQGNGGYEEVHSLKIRVDAPTRKGEVNPNGSYSGELVVLFEPAAYAGSDIPPERDLPPSAR